MPEGSPESDLPSAQPAAAEPEWIESLDLIRQTYQLIGGPALFGAELSLIERGRAEFRLPISPLTAGGAAGGVHGGIMAALIDIAVVSAVRTLCVRGDVMRGTAELNVSYLRPANGSALLISGTILKKGSSLAVGDAEVRDDASRLVAKGRLTYSLGRADR
jgi:acyl-CoA thioesterase